MWKPFAALAAALAITAAAPAAGAAYPDRPVKIIVGYAPGATVDMVTRKLAERLQRQTGQTFIVENRPGVGGMIGAAVVAHSAADGYTLLAYDDTYVGLPATTKNLAVDPIAAFVPVTVAAYTPGVLVVPGNSPHKTLASFIAYAKAHPGKMNYGAGSIGASLGLATEAFKHAAGVDIQHVPFKGGAETVANLMAGTIDMALLSTPTVAAQIQAGKLRALAVVGPHRLPLFPAVPTFEEAGLHFGFSKWTGIAAPAGTPKELLATIHAQIHEALESADMQAYLKQNNARAGGQTPEVFAQQVREESRQWADIARTVGLDPR